MTREELDKKIEEARKRSLLIYQKAFMLFGCMKWNKILRLSRNICKINDYCS